MPDVASLWIPYCGPSPGPSDWLDRWNLDPVLIAGLAALLAWGWSQRQETFRHQTAAALLIAALFVSPLCALGSALFSFRAVHHLALVYLLAPLIAAAVVPTRHGSSIPLAAATALQAAVLWSWHLPSLYAAAFRSDAVFWAMQLSITASAMLWWAALRRAAWLAATASLLAGMVQMGLLGALILFAGRPLYAPHWLTTGAWGLAPLEDQQVAGLLMWVGGGGICLALAAVLIYRGLASPAPELRRA